MLSIGRDLAPLELYMLRGLFAVTLQRGGARRLCYITTIAGQADQDCPSRLEPPRRFLRLERVATKQGHTFRQH